MISPQQPRLLFCMPKQTLQPPVRRVQRMGAMPSNTFKTIALDFALQVRGIEDTYVTAGGFRVVLSGEPTDFLRPSPWHCETQLPVGF